MSDDEILEQLWAIYKDFEWWHNGKKTKEEIDRYHRERLASGNIITVESNGLLLGYLEFYFNHGCCFINNLFIRPEYRRGETAKLMKKRLFEVCKGAKVFAGERNRFGKRYPEIMTRR